MDPWEIALWVVLGILIGGSAFGVIGLKTYQSGIGSGIGQWIRDYFTELVLYLPNALVLFGFLVDTVNQEVRYSIASLIGVMSVFANSIVSALAQKFTGATPSGVTPGTLATGCTVPGFEYLESLFSPQGLVLPTSIFTYLVTDFARNRTSSQNMGIAILMPLFIILQAVVMWTCNCFGNYYWGSPWLTIGSGILIGGIFGQVAYWIVDSFFPDKLPSAGLRESFVTGNVIKGSKKPVSTEQVKKESTCSANLVSASTDDDEFVVAELYKNGELVTSAT